MANILLVDDQEQLRSMLKIVLEEAGHEVAEASNGNAAFESYCQRPADLLITDIVMPDKEGLETIRQLRERYPDIKIIAMSGGGRSQLNYLDVAKLLGAKQVLAKPFSNGDLLDAVNRVLGLG